MIPTARAVLLGAGMGVLHLAPSLWRRLHGSEPGTVLATAALVGTILAWAALHRAWVDAGTLGARARIGLSAGLAYHLASAHWVAHAFLAPGQTVSPAAAWGLAGTMILLVPPFVAGHALAHLLAGRGADPIQHVVAFTLGISLFDVVLGDRGLGIPLGAPSLAFLDTPLQPILAVLGLHGATAMLVGVSALLGTCWGMFARVLARVLAGLLSAWNSSQSNGDTSSAATSAIAIAIAMATAIAIVATTLLALVEPADAPAASVSHVDPVEEFIGGQGEASPEAVVALVQPGLHAPIETLADLVAQAFAAGAVLVALPELAVPFDIASRPDAPEARALTAAVPPGGVLVAGHVRVDRRPAGETRASNTVTALGHDGVVLAVVDKAHLVPFGEEFPPLLRRVGLRPVAGPPGGYDAAARLTVMRLPGVAPLAPLICFEGILSGAVSRETDGAAWLLNLSNEAAFGDTVGPALLLSHARVRAIETGLPMLRSAATAHTAIIDPDGTVLRSLGLGGTGVLMASAPGASADHISRPGQATATNSHPASYVAVTVRAMATTSFRRWGYMPLQAAWALGLAALLGGRLRSGWDLSDRGSRRARRGSATKPCR